ncbi:MAG: hypothetical protein AAFO91_05710 [Bacteroidota bacterium]
MDCFHNFDVRGGKREIFDTVVCAKHGVATQTTKALPKRENPQAQVDAPLLGDGP